MTEPLLVGIVSFVALLILILWGVPIAASMALVGLLGFWAIVGWKPMLSMLGMLPYSSVTPYTLTAVPLFVLMGNFAYRARFGEEVFLAAREWVGGFPGGIAQATVLGSAAFGAATGSTMAAAATMAKIAVPEMRKYGYDKTLASASVAASGTMATMIPPSIGMILYGMLTETSVGGMFMAGIFPGLLMAFSYMVMITIRTIRNPSLGKAITGITWRKRFAVLKGVWGIAFIVVCVLGGIYSGIVTPTEAGAAGCLGALLLGIATRRLNLSDIWQSLLDTAAVVGMLFLIIVGAFILNSLYAVTRIPQLAGDWIVTLALPPLGIVGIFALFWLMLGTFMNGVAMMFLSMPVFFPIAMKLGFHPIWFGIVFLHTAETGMITPPFGLTIFATKSALPADISVEDIIRGVLPFVIMDCIVLCFLLYFPNIALFLPSLMK